MWGEALHGAQLGTDRLLEAVEDFGLVGVDGFVGERAVFVAEAQGERETLLACGDSLTAIDIDELDFLEFGRSNTLHRGGDI